MRHGRAGQAMAGHGRAWQGRAGHDVALQGMQGVAHTAGSYHSYESSFFGGDPIPSPPKVLIMYRHIISTDTISCPNLLLKIQYSGEDYK